MREKGIRLSLCEDAELEDIGEGYICELKEDGIRSVSVEGRLFNRKSGSNKLGKNITSNFPEIRPPEDCILDGEIVSEEGLPDVVGRVHLEDDFRTSLRAQENPCRFVAFDIIFFERKDLRSLALWERKAILSSLSLGNSTGVEIIPFFTNPNPIWEKVKAENLEGMIAKSPNSTYSGKRTKNWLKVKNWKEKIFEIRGSERTKNGGFVIYVELENGGIQKVAVNGIREQKTVVENPNSKAEIRFLEITDAGRLRKPSMKKILRD